MTDELITQPTAKPTRKVMAGMYGGGLGGALAWVVVEILGHYRIDVPMEVQHALIAVITAALGSLSAYLTRSRAGDG